MHCRQRIEAQGADEMLDRIVSCVEYVMVLARTAAAQVQQGVMFGWPVQHCLGQGGDYMGQVPPPHAVHAGGNYRYVSPPAWEPPIQMQPPQMWTNGAAGVMCAGPPFNLNGDFPEMFAHDIKPPDNNAQYFVHPRFSMFSLQSWRGTILHPTSYICRHVLNRNFILMMADNLCLSVSCPAYLSRPPKGCHHLIQPTSGE